MDCYLYDKSNQCSAFFNNKDLKHENINVGCSIYYFKGLYEYQMDTVGKTELPWIHFPNNYLCV